MKSSKILYLGILIIGCLLGAAWFALEDGGGHLEAYRNFFRREPSPSTEVLSAKFEKHYSFLGAGEGSEAYFWLRLSNEELEEWKANPGFRLIISDLIS